MPKIDITRTELVWPGKYDDEGNLVPPRRVSLPFQVIELINESYLRRTSKRAAITRVLSLTAGRLGPRMPIAVRMIRRLDRVNHLE